MYAKKKLQPGGYGLKESLQAEKRNHFFYMYSRTLVNVIKFKMI